MKIRVETTEDEDEIVIKCRHPDEGAELLRRLIDSGVIAKSELLLYVGNTEYYVDKNAVLFFETCDGRVYAHTAGQMLRCDYKLFELEAIMPAHFVRISKSAIANIKLISSLSRELTGNGRITFKDSDKAAYFSRAYYKLLKDKIDEVRFS